MPNMPFLARFARFVPDCNIDKSLTAGSEQKGVRKPKSRPLSTIATKVDRETTDDR